MLAQIKTAAVVGMEGRPVLVEVHIGSGLPSTSFVGLPDTAVREAKDRVRAALLSSGLEWPNRRVTINLAPADIPKLGSSYDLAIALGILVADGELESKSVEDLWVFGELGLDGSVRPAPGLLAVARAVLKRRALLVCAERDIPQVQGLNGLRLAPIKSVRELVESLDRRSTEGGLTSQSQPQRVRGLRTTVVARTENEPNEARAQSELDLADVRGQPVALRAAEIAAAGNLNLLMYGPPGSGKTMIARRLPGILPHLDDESAMEVQLIHSLIGSPRRKAEWRRPPFRAPHHTCSTPALVGGGSGLALPGEVSLAHRGILFLDELSLFSQHTLDALRQPMEDGEVVISRSRATVKYPSAAMLVAASNPCPCGNYNSQLELSRRTHRCRCPDAAVERHRRRVSGPLLDRFDLAVQVTRVEPEAMIDSAKSASSSTVLRRVESARGQQEERLGSGVTVKDVAGVELSRRLPLSKASAEFLTRLSAACGFSGRRIHRIIRAAWLIAFLDGRDEVGVDDIEEAGRLWVHPYGDS